jgi:hypothetical protein
MKSISNQCKDLIKGTVLKITNASEQNQDLNDILNHGSWWATTYEPITITFLDLIKGIVPTELSSKIHNITNNNEATTEILFQTYDLIYKLTQEVWLDRCTKIVTAEQSKNISRRHKCSPSKTNNSYRRSAYVDSQYYPDSHKVLRSGRSLIDKMVTLGCHYSNF